MGHPWGLYGLDFLGSYLVAMAAVIVVPLCLFWLARLVPGIRPAGELSPYAVGFLAGGPKRVAEIILAELTGSGVLRVSSAGQVSQVVGETRTGPYAAALDRAWPAGLPSGLKTSHVLDQVGKDSAIRRIGDELRARRMLVSRPRMVAVQLITLALTAWLLAAGIWGMTDDLVGHSQLGALVSLLVMSMLISAVMILVVSAQAYRTTTLGARYLRHDVRRIPVPWPESLAVALLGLTAMSDVRLRDALLAGLPTPDTETVTVGCGCGCGCGGGCGG